MLSRERRTELSGKPSGTSTSSQEQLSVFTARKRRETRALRTWKSSFAHGKNRRRKIGRTQVERYGPAYDRLSGRSNTAITYWIYGPFMALYREITAPYKCSITVLKMSPHTRPESHGIGPQRVRKSSNWWPYYCVNSDGRMPGRILTILFDLGRNLSVVVGFSLRLGEGDIWMEEE